MNFTLKIMGTASAMPISDRNPSAQVLSVHGRLFLIDCGEGTQQQLRRAHLAFLKIDAISLGYTINMKKWQKYIDAIDLYLTVRNVACLTGYSGLNPEVNINGLDPGYEWYNDLYPETRRYTFGVKLTF